MAPNLLTFSGWFLLVINFALFTYYDFDFHTTSNDFGLVRKPIPSWVWLYCGVAQFLSHTLDGADGKQARRTKSTSPLGNIQDSVYALLLHHIKNYITETPYMLIDHKMDTIIPYLFWSMIM